jgi:hypothetical protein
VWTWLYVQTCHAGHVAAGSVNTGDESNVNWVGRYPEDDWNARRRRLRCRRRAAGSYKYGHLLLDETCRKLRQPTRVRLRPSIFYVDVLALYIT